MDGGYLVWQDNAIDGSNLGVAGCRVDANLSPVSDVFRVNRSTAGDQTRPAVALLPGGGAVFAFEGSDSSSQSTGSPSFSSSSSSRYSSSLLSRYSSSGSSRFGSRSSSGSSGQSNPDAFVRFMLPDGQFSSQEISLTPGVVNQRNTIRTNRVSWSRNQLRLKRWSIRETYTLERDQTADPRPAALPDGRVIVLYSGLRKYRTNSFEIVTTITSRNRWGTEVYTTNDVLQPVEFQGNSGLDIFLQVFGSNLKPSGPEVMVNQLVENHQRQPAVAVLPDGRFVVAWVSEDRVAQIPMDTSLVVIRARWFNADGQPGGDEFVVSNPERICARPAVSAALGGGFAVVWNQRDLVATNSWDVYGRIFDAHGSASGEAFRINRYTYRDQHSPSISPLGEYHLVVWTSVAQDGSREGVFGRLLSPAGLAGEEFQVNATSASQQIHPAAVAQGPDRAVVFWSSFVGEESFEILNRICRPIPPLPAPDPPEVAVLDQTQLRVSWSPEPAANLANYELYMDSLGSPFVLSANSYLAKDLDPGSTHSFQLAYMLSDGRRSLRSRPVTGTTLPAPGTEPPDPPAEPGDDPGQVQVGPGAPPAGSPDLVLRVGIQFVGNSVELSWNTRPGGQYQVQISNDLERWLDFGLARRAWGSVDALIVNPKEPVAWFRVLELP